MRETIGLGGKRESVPDGPLTLAGERDISRLTFTFGRLSPTDMFDNNTYPQDSHTQFMNWAMITNLAWDFPADSVGYTTGLVVELNQPRWALRYGFFQGPNTQSGFTADDQILLFPRAEGDGPFFRSWGMVTEFERRYAGHCNCAVESVVVYLRFDLGYGNARQYHANRHDNDQFHHRKPSHTVEARASFPIRLIPMSI
jgi:hypothetical protein